MNPDYFILIFLLKFNLILQKNRLNFLGENIKNKSGNRTNYMRIRSNINS